MSERQLSALAGSQLALPSGAEPAGPVDDDERVELTLVLRPPDSRPAAGSPEARHGPRLEDVNAVLGWAAECALALEALSPVARTIRLSAPLGRWRELLDLELSLYAWEGTTFRGRSGSLNVPAGLVGALIGVFGLDTRPVAWHAPVVSVAESATVSPLQLRSAYRLPVGVDGDGQCIGIIALGGRADRGDLAVEAMRFGLPVPDLATVPAAGGSLSASHAAHGAATDNLAIALDTQVPATLAPAAQLVVYSAPNTAQGLLETVAAALTDRERRASVLLVNWSSAEQDGLLSASLMRSLDAMFATADALGITVLASTSLHIDPRARRRASRTAYPASSPYAVACSDTELVVSAGGVESQATWIASRGSDGTGASRLFERPTWQLEALQPGASGTAARRTRPTRTTPDVSAHGAGFLVTAGGMAVSVGGGGSGAAVWAGTVALLNQSLGRRVGLLTPRLYSAAAAGRRTGTGWGPDVGLGPPDGAALLRALRAD